MNILMLCILSSLLLGLIGFTLRCRRGAALRRGLVVSVLLPVMCFSICSEAVLATDSGIDLAEEDSGGSKRYAVCVAYSTSRANCETCVDRLRSRGYNAYLYRSSGSKKYAIVIGAYSTSNEAKQLATELHNQKNVKGVDLPGAFAINVNLSDGIIDLYSDPYWPRSGGTAQETGSRSEGTVSRNVNDPVDVFLSNECDVAIYAVQVAASNSLKDCKTCVIRLRRQNYNAFIYRAEGSAQYRIMIGIFSDVYEGEEYAEYLHERPAVKGVTLNKAYATKARITSEGYRLYCDPNFSAVTATQIGSSSTPSPTTAPTMKPNRKLTPRTDLREFNLCTQKQWDSSNNAKGTDIELGAWIDCGGVKHPDALRFWVRKSSGYTNTESVTYYLGGSCEQIELTFALEKSSGSGASCRFTIRLDGKLYKTTQEITANNGDSMVVSTFGCKKLTIECTTDDAANVFGILQGSVYCDGEFPQADTGKTVIHSDDDYDDDSEDDYSYEDEAPQVEAAPLTPLSFLKYTKKTEYIEVGTEREEIYTDVNGDEYDEDSVICRTYDSISSWSNSPDGEDESYICYQLNRNYSTLQGIIYRPYDTLSDMQKWTTATTVKFYGDGELLYEAPYLDQSNYDTIPVELDVSGVRELKIVILGTWNSKGNFYGFNVVHPRVCLAEFYLAE